MFKKSNLVKTVAAGAAMLLLASCSSAGTNGDSEASGDEVRTLRLGHFMEPSHAHEVCGVTELQAQLEGSGIEVVSYPSAQLGGQTEALEQVYTGNLDMSLNGSAFVGTYYDDFNAMGLGYLFNDGESLLKFYETDKFAEILDSVYEASGMRVFPGWYYGSRHITANKPVLSPEDLKGLKLRVPDALAFIDTLQAMGATPTPMALDELYMGLQQGTVDAQENPSPVIKTMNLYEVQKDLSLTGHMIDGIHIVIAGKVWESLTDEQKVAMENAISAAGAAASQCVMDQEQEYLDEFKADGTIAVHEVDTTEFAKLVREKFSTGYPYSELYNEILASQD